MKMSPDSGTVKKAPQGASAYCLSIRGKAYAIYLSGPVGAKLGLELPKGDYQVDWINVLTGKTEKSERLVHEQGIAELSAPAYHSDIALRIIAK